MHLYTVLFSLFAFIKIDHNISVVTTLNFKRCFNWTITYNPSDGLINVLKQDAMTVDFKT